MIYLFTWIFIISAGFFIYKVIGNSIREDKRNHEVLKRQAKKRNGTVQKMLFMAPMLEFSYNGINITVASPSPETSWSFIKCSMKQCRAFTCIIMPRSVLSSLSMRSRPPEVHLSEPLLSDRFAINANDKDMTERFLDTDVREAFIRLDSWEKLELKNGFFELRIPGTLIDDQSADCFIESALVMIRRLIELHKNTD